MRPGESALLALPVGGGTVMARWSAAAPGQPALLLVPPFFHEWQRSYRLFALLADALRQRGVSVLRFDYRGSGDSSGESTDFTPERALEDTLAALTALEQKAGVPARLLGIRGGALLAALAAERTGRDWWSWQPCHSGAAHAAELQALDARERANRQRFPYLRRSLPADPGTCLGFRLASGFFETLAGLRPGKPALGSFDRPALASSSAFALEPAFTDWVGQIDIEGSHPLPAVAALAARLDAVLRPGPVPEALRA